MNERVRILIADDQQATRQGLKALLAMIPHIEVTGEAANGQEAIKAVAAHRPDVVLMDVQMPVMDGLEATRRIKSQWPAVKVIILSMFARYRADAAAAGADGFLIKGCAVETLQAVILGTIPSRDHQTTSVNRKSHLRG